MNKVVPFVTFAIGAAVGSAVTWYISKTKYEQIVQEEIESIKEVFSGRGREEIVEEAVNKIEESQDDLDIKNVDIKQYAKTLSEGSYTEYSEVELVERADMPYVISPAEFGEMDGYDVTTLLYFADKILADDDYELVENVDKVVGYDSLSRFGEYEDDAVYVRNDVLKTDYEILYDHRKYLDVLKTKPHPVEVE